MDNLIECLDDISNNNNNLNENIEKIRKFFNIEESNNSELLLDLINKYKISFKDWLEKLVKTEPVPNEIKGLYFGLFEQNNGAVLYIAGSERNYEEDDDWACDPDYWPDERYLDFKDLNEISETIKQLNIKMWKFVLATTMVIIKDYFQLYYEDFNKLVNNQTLFIGVGFDDGDFYILNF